MGKAFRARTTRALVLIIAIAGLGTVAGYRIDRRRVIELLRSIAGPVASGPGVAAIASGPEHDDGSARETMQQRIQTVAQETANVAL
jgi:hypothetical protein